MRLVVGEIVHWCGQDWRVEGVTRMNTCRFDEWAQPRTFVQLQLLPQEQPAVEVVAQEVA